MAVLGAIGFTILVASLFLDVASRLRPPRDTDLLGGAWDELTAPREPVNMDQPVHWTFRNSSFPSWFWKLGRFELDVPVSPGVLGKRLKQALRAEPAYALFLPIGGRAVGWVEGGRFQVSLIGAMSRRPSSWIADGAIVPAGDGAIMRCDFILRKARLVPYGVLAVWILIGALYAWSSSTVNGTVPFLTVLGIAVYLGFLRLASWMSGRRLRRFLVGVASQSDRQEPSESVGYAAMIRGIEDELSAPEG